jgi:hypothetical protein
MGILTGHHADILGIFPFQSSVKWQYIIFDGYLFIIPAANQ